ncbi:MAG: GNAT family N-acetyltransferase [Thermoplasmata archaeon]
MEIMPEFQKIENFYGEYMLQEGCAIVMANTLDGGFLYGSHEVYPFGKPTAFESALKVIGNRKNLFFPAINEQYVEIIEKKFPFLKRREAYFYTLKKEDFRGKQRHECRTLQPGDVKTIAKYWGSGEEEYIKTRIEKYPSCGIYDGEQLVAWVGIHNLTPRIAIMGFLHVLEPYRGRGLAESVSAWLATKIFESGRIIGIHIWTDNKPSNNLAKKLGFEFRCIHSWFWYK